MAGKEKTKSLREEYPNSIPLTGSGGETYKWDTPGKTLKGRFVKLREGSMGGHLVLIDTGDRVETASAPGQLVDALDSVKPGQLVVIRYLGEEKSKKTGMNYKTFEAAAIEG